MSSTLWRSRRRGERPVIYGRERECAQLRELLVDDLVEDATERGCLVLTGGCFDLTRTPSTTAPRRHA